MGVLREKNPDHLDQSVKLVRLKLANIHASD